MSAIPTTDCAFAGGEHLAPIVSQYRKLGMGCGAIRNGATTATCRRWRHRQYGEYIGNCTAARIQMISSYTFADREIESEGGLCGSDSPRRGHQNRRQWRTAGFCMGHRHISTHVNPPVQPSRGCCPVHLTNLLCFSLRPSCRVGRLHRRSRVRQQILGGVDLVRRPRERRSRKTLGSCVSQTAGKPGAIPKGPLEWRYGCCLRTRLRQRDV